MKISFRSGKAYRVYEEEVTKSDLEKEMSNIDAEILRHSAKINLLEDKKAALLAAIAKF